MLIAIEGIDGSGKGTQAGRLKDRLLATGASVELFSFPRYDATRFGKAIGDFLNGRFGSLDAVHPLLASVLYAGDRFETRELLLRAIQSKDVVVLDRYVASNIAHQGAKLRGEPREELRAWIEAMEHEVFALPPPDLQILLDLPAEAAQELIAKKSPRDYTEKKADLQEADGAYLAAVRDVYRQLAVDHPHWRIVRCMKEGMLRGIHEIGDEIFGIVQTMRHTELSRSVFPKKSRRD